MLSPLPTPLDWVHRQRKRMAASLGQGMSDALQQQQGGAAVDTWRLRQDVLRSDGVSALPGV